MSEIKKRIYPETHEQWLQSMRNYKGGPMFGFRRVPDHEIAQKPLKINLAASMSADYPAEADGSVPPIEMK